MEAELILDPGIRQAALLIAACVIIGIFGALLP